MDTLNTALIVECLATAASLAFLVLLIRERILCWPFAIVGSLLSTYLFIDAKLYSEAVLYIFYAVMGVWGWLRWSRREAGEDNPVITHRPLFHLAAVVLVGLAAVALGNTMLLYTDAQRPLFDATTTCFSFFATWLEINKVLEAWVYWFFLNCASIWLYHDRNLDIYAVLIAVYSLMSVWGFIAWRRSWRAQQAAAVAE